MSTTSSPMSPSGVASAPYLAGLLHPGDRHKTVTALAGAAPIVEAREAAAQRLQVFLSASVWDAAAVNARRLALTWADTALASHTDGARVIDETGDRTDDAKTAHVARRYPGFIGFIGKIGIGIGTITSLWADERVHYPLHVEPDEPAVRLPRGTADPAVLPKLQLLCDQASPRLPQKPGARPFTARVRVRCSPAPVQRQRPGRPPAHHPRR